MTELDDFSVRQIYDNALKNAFIQIMAVDGQSVQAGAILTIPHFSIIMDQKVPKSHRGIFFHIAHYNPMAGHLVVDDTLVWLMACFLLPGLSQ